MKPEKFVGIMLLTLLLSCEMEDQQIDQQVGAVSFETNQYMMNSSFEIDIYIDGDKVKLKSYSDSNNETTIVTKNLNVGIHNYEVKVFTYNGEPSKSIKGRFMIQNNKTAEVFIDFKNYNSWI